MARMTFGNAGSPGFPGGGPFGGGGGGGRGAAADGEPPRRQRSVYTSEQISQLEAFFSMNEYIDGERKKQLSRMTNIPEQQIKVWFQNRRQKKKREMEEQQQQAIQQRQQQQQQLGHSPPEQHHRTTPLKCAPGILGGPPFPPPDVADEGEN